MPISPAERRFLRTWDEQRQGGKAGFVATYTFGITIAVFLSSIALGLFMSLPFVKQEWLIAMGIVSVISAFFISLFLWGNQQNKFKRIIKREIDESSNQVPS